MRWLVVLGSLIALLGSRANAQGACEGVDAVYDLKDNLNAREITLGLTAACTFTFSFKHLHIFFLVASPVPTRLLPHPTLISNLNLIFPLLCD